MPMRYTIERVRSMIIVMRETAERRSGAKAAIVVTSDVAFGMARMVELRTEAAESPSFRVFREMAEAEEWLDLE
jgi:hypothetical protein